MTRRFKGDKRGGAVAVWRPQHNDRIKRVILICPEGVKSNGVAELEGRDVYGSCFNTSVPFKLARQEHHQAALLDTLFLPENRPIAFRKWHRRCGEFHPKFGPSLLGPKGGFVYSGGCCCYHLEAL